MNRASYPRIDGGRAPPVRLFYTNTTLTTGAERLSYCSSLMIRGFSISDESRQRWLEASGANELQRRADSAGDLTFKELVSTASAKLAPEERASIAQDVGRSQVAGYAAAHLFDDDAFRAQHSARIRDVLVIFVADRADWGYCQGFNFVASALLLLLRGDVETTAWLQDALYSRFFISSFFARQPKMSGFHTEVEVLAILVAETFPCIDDVLDESELEMTAQLLGFRWFVPCWTTGVFLFTVTF